MAKGRPSTEHHLISTGMNTAKKFLVDTFVEFDFLEESLKESECCDEDILKQIRNAQGACLWLYQNLEGKILRNGHNSNRSKQHIFSARYGQTCPRISEEEIQFFLNSFAKEKPTQK